MKQCTHCLQSKAFSNFYQHSGSKGGYAPECVDCHKDYNRTPEGLAKQMFSNQTVRSKKRSYGPVGYTKEQLYTWMIAQPNFMQLYNAWKAAGYLKDLRPSVDRLDDYLPYTLTNIRLTTTKDNVSKGAADRISGKNTKTSRAVDMLDDWQNLIQRFHSISAAARHIGKRPGNINNAVRAYPAKLLKSYGYYWRPSTIPNP